MSNTPSSSFNLTMSNLSLSSYEKRLHLRSLQSKVQNTLDDDDDNLNCDDRVSKLQSIMDEVESEVGSCNNRDRPNTGDTLMHSELLKATSNLTVKCTELAAGEWNNYDKLALADHIAECPGFWDFPFPKEVPIVSYLYGTFAPTPPEQRPRASRRRVEKQRTGELKVAQSVTSIKKVEESSKVVQQVLNYVNSACRKGPLSYFHLVLDPDDFSQTIENIYHFSFLVKDGLVSLYVDDKYGLPFVKKVSSTHIESSKHVERKYQFIISMDMHKWRNLVKAFNITSAMMKLKRK